MLRFALACILTLICSESAAEPVSTAIGLTALLGGGAVAGAIGGALVGIATALGISYAAKALLPTHAPQTGADALPADATQDVGVTRFQERASIPSKRVIVGRGYVGGALFFEAAIGGTQSTTGQGTTSTVNTIGGRQGTFLYLGFLISLGPIDAFEKVWVGANDLQFQAINTNAILLPPPNAGQPAYNTHLKLSMRLGSSTQTIDPLLAADFLNLNSNFRQQGIATAVFRCSYGASANEFAQIWGQAQRPAFFLLCRGVKVYDPRDTSQALSDETTWKWSNNASLIQAWFLTRSYGGRIPSSRILWDKVAVAADFDDESVPCKDGSGIRRYTIDGVITLNQTPVEVMNDLLTANRGYVLESGGKVWVSSSKPRTPIGTIYDAILAGGIEYRNAKPKRDLINKLLVRFVAQEQAYQMVDGPILNRTDLQTADGEVLTATISLPFTLDHRRAQRLQKAYLQNARLGKTITCRVDVAFLAELTDELIGSAVNFSSVLFSQANGIYLCTGVAFADNFASLELQLQEYNSSIETDWVAATDEQTFSLAQLTLS